MRRIRNIFMVGVASAAALLTGCGGDEPNGTEKEATVKAGALRRGDHLQGPKLPEPTDELSKSVEASIGVVALSNSLGSVTGQAGGLLADVGSEELSRYFEAHTIARQRPLADIRTKEDWEKKKPELRTQLYEMLGIHPYKVLGSNPRSRNSALSPTITGRIVRDGVLVEKLHFQSMPGLYVTANFYMPDDLLEGEKLPTILYVCGHARREKDGISYGNKTAYHHYGVWFAQNRYACLIIDTIQLGEIRGIHRGMMIYSRTWWNARGYTPAGVEAWNGIRALDYLESRPEVDKGRIGVAGRSGGGAYSWWAASLDDRIKVAVPAAGIISLKNHLIDGYIEVQCDCMSPLNLYQWDFSVVAALASPRPVLISHTDKDEYFPLDGAIDIYYQARRIYELQGALGNIGLHIEEGPHRADSQPARSSTFHWINRHLKNTDRFDTFEKAAVKIFEPEELKVFDELPSDELNTRIDNKFVKLAEPAPVATNEVEWQKQQSKWIDQLEKLSFRNWPKNQAAPELKKTFEGKARGILLRSYELVTEPNVTCSLILALPDESKLEDLESLVLHVLDEDGWTDFISHIPQLFPDALPGTKLPDKDDGRLKAELERHLNPDSSRGVAYFCPRGIGPNSWSRDERKRIQIRRRFAMIGQSLDGMRVWDIIAAIRGVRAHGLGDAALTLEASGPMAGNAIYASIFTKQPVSSLDLHDLPSSHRHGPILLNVLRILDLPQAAAMAAERSQLRVYTKSPESWNYPRDTAFQLGWPAEQVVIQKQPKKSSVINLVKYRDYQFPYPKRGAKR